MTPEDEQPNGSASTLSPPTPPANVGALGHPDAQISMLILGLAALCGGYLLAMPEPDMSLRPGGWWAILVVFIAYGLAEYTVFNVEFGREGIAFTMAEFPLGMALVFVSPFAAVAARAVSALPTLVFARANRGRKLAFNMVLFVHELSFAFIVHRTVLDWTSGSNEALLWTATATMFVSAILNAMIIALAISRYEGQVLDRIVGELRASWWFYPVTSAGSVMVVALALIRPALAALAALPVLGIWFVLNSYGRQQQELRDLDGLHGVTGRIGGSLDVTEISDLSIDEVQAQMHGSGVALIRFTETEAVTSLRGDVPLKLPDSVTDEGWGPIFAERATRVISLTELHRLGIAKPSLITPIMVAPLVDHGESFGVLVVVERKIIGVEFSGEDTLRLQNLAGQIAVSLRRGMLHERLEYEARHDALTGLPARTLFERHVNEAIVGREGTWAVIMLDLDRFKEVNDTLGHHAGDALLIEFSRRMSSLLGPDDVLSRLAGDEFAILCRRDQPEEFAEMAARCLADGGRPVTLDGLEIVVTVSVGIAEVIGLDENALQPMRRADIAMYNAKWQRTGVELYRDEIDRRTPARLSMLGDLRAAIEGNGLDVMFQPKLDLVSGEIVGVEALVRWEHAVRGFVAPTEFVRVAEDTGLIKELTDLVLARGIAALRSFNEMGLSLGLAVNLSTHDLFDARLPDRVRGYLESNGVSPEQLTLEITESSLLVDAPRTRATIDDLHAVGLRLAVDDFGTGYSSLSYLRRLPVHELKIDQSFVSGMLSDPQDEVIVRSTVDLGHNLGLRVVAEGVEDRACLDRLTEIGCDVAQGYAISRPLTLDELPQWVRSVREFPGAPLDWVAITSA